ncbi:MAG: hypothetical protein K2X35_07760 [Bryobacteraceae bacterium]|nr:hypothetical protein [Bryobacteraceae bacterium]
MSEVLFATPLKNTSVSGPREFNNGISIRALSPISWDFANAKRWVSEEDQEALALTELWLCVAVESDHVEGNADDDHFRRIYQAAMALQVICPTGAKQIFLKFVRTSEGWDNTGTNIGKNLCSTLVGRVARLEDQGLDRFDVIYEGVKTAFAKSIIRVVNPIQLLEHGMQVGNKNLGALMFVMGLDVLLMAGGAKRFNLRLGGFLGLDSWVFPRDSILGCQPETKVSDVLRHLYAFRSIVAHGQEIPARPYRQRHDLLSTDGDRINSGPYDYAELMEEAGLFVLTATLRKIFTESLMEDVADVGRWKDRLRSYERSCSRTGELNSPTIRR